MTENNEEPTELGDVVDMRLDEVSERRWCVLFEEDYDDLLIDADDSVALLVDVDQAVELLRLSAEIVEDLKSEEAPDEHPIDALVDELEDLREDHD